MVDRVSSGVPGFDELVSGGVPEGTVTLVAGSTGSGKTTFASQFLWEGLEDGETCLYITTEELPDEIREDADVFGWDFASYEDDGSLIIEYIDPSTRSNYFREDIEKIVDELEPDRLVVDSVSAVGAYWHGDDEVRAHVNQLIKGFREMDVTALVTAEKPDNSSTQFSRYGIAEYVVDGVVAIGGLSLGKTTFRSLQVIKMRKTAITEDVMGLKLTEDGLVIEEEAGF